MVTRQRGVLVAVWHVGCCERHAAAEALNRRARTTESLLAVTRLSPLCGIVHWTDLTGRPRRRNPSPATFPIGVHKRTPSGRRYSLDRFCNSSDGVDG